MTCPRDKHICSCLQRLKWMKNHRKLCQYINLSNNKKGRFLLANETSTVQQISPFYSTALFLLVKSGLRSLACFKNCPRPTLYVGLHEVEIPNCFGVSHNQLKLFPMLVRIMKFFSYFAASVSYCAMMSKFLRPPDPVIPIWPVCFLWRIHLILRSRFQLAERLNV